MKNNRFCLWVLFLLVSVFLFPTKAVLAVDRIGFCKSYTVDPNNEANLVTVPQGQRFVLLKLYVYPGYSYPYDAWHLSRNGELLISGKIIYGQTHTIYGLGTTPIYSHIHDFPDSCVVVLAGEIVTAVNESAEGPMSELNLTLIGYFENVDTGLVSDLNGDYKVNFADFAILANEWLTVSL